MDVDGDINDDCNWGWQGMEFDGLKDASSDVTSSLWSESTVTTNKEDGSYFSEEMTPVKACGDLAYRVPCNGYSYKESEECRITSPRAKRRRRLEFINEDMDFLFCRDEMSSSFLNTKEMEIPAEEFPLERLQDTSIFPECPSSTGCEGLDLSCEEWLAECFNDTENNKMNSSDASDVEIDISELINFPPDNEANTVQARRIPASGNIVVKKVKKSYFKAPPKLASTIAHPFALIKPCSERGDVTLKDINQRIRPPPPPKVTKPAKQDPPYPTSAFSGKPVVEKTKILTEGGRGSITILRTKG